MIRSDDVESRYLMLDRRNDPYRCMEDWRKETFTMTKATGAEARDV